MAASKVLDLVSTMEDYAGKVPVNDVMIVSNGIIGSTSSAITVNFELTVPSASSIDTRF